MRTYWKALLVLVAMALVMAVDGVALVAVLLTFGLAFPLVFAATGALALLCLYPAVRGWKDNRVRGVLLSAALAAIVFAGPAIVGDWQARRLVAVATSADVAPPAMPENPGSLEIRRPSSGHDGLFEGSGACGSECRALLRSAVWIGCASSCSTCAASHWTNNRCASGLAVAMTAPRPALPLTAATPAFSSLPTMARPPAWC